MRTLKRNEQTFYYANPTGEERVIDSDGYYTGEKSIVYGTPVECHGNISSAIGSVSIEMFGTVEAYDKTLVLCDPDLDVNMTSVFWIDSLEIAEDRKNFDYIVGHISRSLNSISIAVKKVDVR